MRNQRGMTGTECALLVLLSVLWGASFFFARVIVQEVPPFTLVFVRFGSAAGVLGVYLTISRMVVPRSMSIWVAFAVMSALNNLVPVALISWAQLTIPSGLASVLVAATPVFSILVAHCFATDERMSVNKLIGVGLGIAGVAVLTGIDTVDASGRSILAMGGCLTAALSYSFANVFGRRFKRLGIAPTVGAFGQLAATAVMAAPFSIVLDQPWGISPPSLTIWASMLGLILMSTALAYAIFFRLLTSVGAMNLSLVTLLIPVSAILLGTFILGERLSILQLAGMALIGLGLVAIDGRLWFMLISRNVQNTTA